MRNNIIDIKRTPITPLPELITLTEAKAQAIVTYTEDDTFFSGLIIKAIKAIENYCNISIYPYTVILTADLFVSWELPYGPVTGISAVQKRNGNEGSGPASYTTADTGWNTEGEQFLTFQPTGFTGIDWGYPYTQRELRSYGFENGWGWNNRYRITYTTGWPSMPDDLKQAVLMAIAWLYEHRGEETIDKCEAARIMAEPYKRGLWQ